MRDKLWLFTVAPAAPRAAVTIPGRSCYSGHNPGLSRLACLQGMFCRHDLSAGEQGGRNDDRRLLLIPVTPAFGSRLHTVLLNLVGCGADVATSAATAAAAKSKEVETAQNIKEQVSQNLDLANQEAQKRREKAEKDAQQ